MTPRCLPLLLLLSACSEPFPTDSVPLFEGEFLTIGLSEIDPVEVPVDGGFPVCLRGYGFEQDGVGVDVGEQDCQGEPTIYDDARIGCVTPPQSAAGEVEVTVHKGQEQISQLLSYISIDAEPRSVNCCGAQQMSDPYFDPGELKDAAARVMIYLGGVTDDAGNSDQLKVELGLGDFGRRPDEGCWSWSDAEFQSVQGDEMRFVADVIAPEVLGTYPYAFRVSADRGRTWTYCDALDGSAPSCQGDGGGSNDGYNREATIYVQ